MRPVDPKIVDHLNDALTFELSVVNTYFLHARMLDSWGFPKLGKVFYDLSIDEMRDADSLITRILFFEGHPNIQRLNALHVGENAEEMLRLALESEYAAVAQFNAAAQECHDLGDHGTASHASGCRSTWPSWSRPPLPDRARRAPTRKFGWHAAITGRVLNFCVDPRLVGGVRSRWALAWLRQEDAVPPRPGRAGHGPEPQPLVEPGRCGVAGVDTEVDAGHSFTG